MFCLFLSNSFLIIKTSFAMNKFFYTFLVLFLLLGTGAKSLSAQNALNFDGTNDFVNCGNAASLQLSTGTIEAWVKTSNAGTGFRGIVVKNSAYGLFMNDNVLIGYSWGATGIITTSTSLNDNAWHHVAMSFQSGVTNGTKVYIDGVLKTTSLLTVSAQTVGLSIGAGNDGGGQNFTGNIEDVRIWSTVRTATEIANNRGCELAGTESGLVSYYKMNQGTAGGTNTGITTLTDTKNVSNGTLTNFALTGSTSNWVASTAINSVSIAASATSIVYGTSVTFTATASGGTSPTYQWKRNGTNVGTNSNTYTNATLDNNDIITCVVTSTSTCGTSLTATSNAITMSVTVTPSVSIVASPSGTIPLGTNVTFTATPTNGGTTPTYQWKKNGNNVGLNSSTYSDATLQNGDVVSCVMTSNASNASPTTATSNAITMSVTITPSVSIVASPSGTITSGTNVTFTATPTDGGTTPTYQWKKNGNNVGLNSSTYSDATLQNGDVISCVMTSSASNASPTTATSNGITMTVIVTPNALHFDGTNDYVSVPDASSLDLTSTFTLESWVSPTAYATTAAPTFGIQGFMGKNRDNTGGLGYFFGMISGNLTVLLNNNVTNVGAVSTTLVPLNTWSHVAATYDGTTIRMYLNGTQVFTQALSGFSCANSTQPLYIGGTGTAGASTWLFQGSMDEARIWNTTRSAAQIANNYNCPLTGSESGLVTYHKFNQGIAAGSNTGITTLIDATANGNNGALTNFALTGTTSNWVSSSASVTPSVSIAANQRVRL
jgi:hypothetical protein